jgi:hypothetical protein
VVHTGLVISLSFKGSRNAIFLIPNFSSLQPYSKTKIVYKKKSSDDNDIEQTNLTFDVYTTVKICIVVLWFSVMTPRGVVSGYQSFEETYCFRVIIKTTTYRLGDWCSSEKLVTLVTYNTRCHKPGDHKTKCTVQKLYTAKWLVSFTISVLSFI